MIAAPPLTTRQTSTLLLLARFRYLTRGQLDSLVLANDGLTPQSRQVISKRILASLVRLGLIQASLRLHGGPGGGSTRSAYKLTAAGQRLTSRLNPDYQPRRPGGGPGTFLLQHSLATVDAYLAFGGAVGKGSGPELLDWECDWETMRRVGRTGIVPDAHLVVATDQQEVEAFLEIDLGTEGTRHIIRKLTGYLDLYRSGSWRRALPGWPTILIVTIDAARAKRLQRITEDLLGEQADAGELRTQVEFSFGSLKELVELGPLAPIWSVAGHRGRKGLITIGQAE